MRPELTHNIDKEVLWLLWTRWISPRKLRNEENVPQKRSGMCMDYVHRSCVSLREVLTPAIIFKDKDLQVQWFLQDSRKLLPGIIYALENGWTSNEIAISWLEHVYLPQTDTTASR